MTLCKHSSEFLWGLYEQFKNHFPFLKLISTERLSMLQWDLDCNKRDGVSSLIYNRRPAPLSFLSYLCGVVKPSILNWAKGHSTFVLEIREMSIFFSSIYIKESNFFISNRIYVYLTQFNRWADFHFLQSSFSIQNISYRFWPICDIRLII